MIRSSGGFLVRLRPINGSGDSTGASAGAGVIEIRAKNVVLATGGSQKMPRPLRPTTAAAAAGQKAFLSSKVMQVCESFARHEPWQ